MRTYHTSTCREYMDTKTPATTRVLIGEYRSQHGSKPDRAVAYISDLLAEPTKINNLRICIPLLLLYYHTDENNPIFPRHVPERVGSTHTTAVHIISYYTNAYRIISKSPLLQRTSERRQTMVEDIVGREKQNEKGFPVVHTIHSSMIPGTAVPP